MFITKKINRYKTAPLIILIIIVLSIGFHFISELQKMFFLYAILYTWIIVTFLYFLLVLTLGRLIKNDLASILLNSGFAILFTSKMFRVMHWPGAKTLLIVSASTILAGLCLILYIKLKRKTFDVDKHSHK